MCDQPSDQELLIPIDVDYKIALGDSDGSVCWGWIAARADGKIWTDISNVYLSY